MSAKMMLKNYLKRKTSRAKSNGRLRLTVHKLREYAEICQVKTIILPYLKALVG